MEEEDDHGVPGGKGKGGKGGGPKGSGKGSMRAPIPSRGALGQFRISAAAPAHPEPAGAAHAESDWAGQGQAEGVHALPYLLEDSDGPRVRPVPASILE